MQSLISFKHSFGTAALAVMATIAIVFTWAKFPQIGTEQTTLAMRAIVSYGWPLCVVWFAWLATALRPPRKGLLDQLLGVSVRGVVVILAGCWGLYIWQEMVTSPNRFYSDFLPFFAMVLGGLPVLGFYWGGMLFTLLIVFECLMRFIPGHEFDWVHDPTYVASSYSSGGSDAGFGAASYDNGSAESESELTIERSDSGDAQPVYSSKKTVAERDDDAIAQPGIRGQKIYSGTSWFNEELNGRVDEEGNLYKGTNWFTEEKIGRIDDEGNIYRGTNWATEVKVGRIDKDGTLYKGSNWFTEDKTGRIAEDGTILKGTNWFNEEKSGRIGD